MKHFDLFSGIGGFALAAGWSGIETVAFCENNDFCRDVLRKHWPGRPVYKDVKEVNGEQLQSDGISADVITGGFPCQPYSVAGDRRGKGDDRHLWPEMLRIIREMEPSWVIGENVRGIIDMELDQVLSDLEDSGYSCGAFIIPACAVDAPHRRERVWIVADSNGKGLQVSEQKEQKRENWKLERSGSRGLGGWPPESGILRVSHGIPQRVDRLKSLGNAVVPHIPYLIFEAIKDVESKRLEISN